MEDYLTDPDTWYVKDDMWCNECSLWVPLEDWDDEAGQCQWCIMDDYEW